MKYLSLVIVFTVLLISEVNAGKLYKRIPFTTAIGTGDIIVVNYDFAEKNGIACSATHHKLWIDFVYKGNQKSASLPVVLENTHVPEKENEELADSNGQFSLFISKNKIDDEQYEVSCDYLLDKNLH